MVEKTLQQYLIRPCEEADADQIWAILEPIIRAGESFTLPQNTSRAETLSYWISSAHQVFVAQENGTIIGTYFLTANQPGGGSHVANCGYAVAPWATGKGIASTMCTHSLAEAARRNFRAMQFNFVISTNERAVELWKRHGFKIVGQLPGAFLHPRLGYVDALIMYRKLDPG